MFYLLPRGWPPLLLILTVVMGCSTGSGGNWRFAKSLDVRRAVGLKKQDELAPPQIPTRLVSTWQDTVLHRTGEKAQRGFGGRLLFFNQSGEAPIRVEGRLVVYAYDENGREAHETHPTRRFIFPTEQFVKHESECKLGTSYSVWLPWDDVGGVQKNISLIARFEPEGGPLVAGDQTRHLLPGTRLLASGDPQPTTPQVGDIRLAQFTQASQVQPLPGKKSKPAPATTSISLSQASWGQRLTNPQKRTPRATGRGQDAVHSAATLPGPARP